MTKAQALLKSLDDLDWNSYIDISEAISYIDESKLNTELAESAQRYTYWGGLLALAKRNLEDSKLKFDQHVAIMSEETRAELLESGVKATDKKVLSKVESSPMYEARRGEVTDSELKYNLMRNLCEALKQRKDMLIQLSANSRKETDLYT